MAQYRPDLSIRFTFWTTSAMKRAVDRICRKWEAHEADVLRYVLEAMIPVAARSGGIGAILSEDEIEELRSPEARKRPEQFPMKLTVRTSAAVKADLDKLTRRRRYKQAELLRYAYQAGLPLALAKGMGHILTLREREMTQRKARKR